MHADRRQDFSQQIELERWRDLRKELSEYQLRELSVVIGSFTWRQELS